MHAITKVATMLNTSEFKLFSEAYLAWFGDRPADNDIISLFSQYTMFGEMPDWASQFAESLLEDLQANRQVHLNSFSVLSLSPRIGKRPEISFSVSR